MGDFIEEIEGLSGLKHCLNCNFYFDTSEIACPLCNHIDLGQKQYSTEMRNENE